MSKYNLLFVLGFVCIQGCNNPEYDRCLRQADSAYDRCEEGVDRDFAGTGTRVSGCGMVRDMAEESCKERYK